MTNKSTDPKGRLPWRKLDVDAPAAVNQLCWRSRFLFSHLIKFAMNDGTLTFASKNQSSAQAIADLVKVSGAADRRQMCKPVDSLIDAGVIVRIDADNGRIAIVDYPHLQVRQGYQLCRGFSADGSQWVPAPSATDATPMRDGCETVPTWVRDGIARYATSPREIEKERERIIALTVYSLLLSSSLFSSTNPVYDSKRFAEIIVAAKSEANEPEDEYLHQILLSRFNALCVFEKWRGSRLCVSTTIKPTESQLQTIADRLNEFEPLGLYMAIDAMEKSDWHVEAGRVGIGDIFGSSEKMNALLQKAI